jgi:hypothetical protein
VREEPGEREQVGEQCWVRAEVNIAVLSVREVGRSEICPTQAYSA